MRLDPPGHTEQARLPCESQAWRGFRAGAAPCGANGATLPPAGYLGNSPDTLDPVLVDQRLEGNVVDDDRGRRVDVVAAVVCLRCMRIEWATSRSTEDLSAGRLLPDQRSTIQHRERSGDALLPMK